MAKLGPPRTHEQVWALTRIDDPAARALVRVALELDATRHSALLSIGLWRDPAALADLCNSLDGGHCDAYDRRAVAEALGRIGDPAAVPALLKAVGTAEDAVLEHSLIYAMIEINEPASVAAGLKSANPRTRRAALIALDQIPVERRKWIAQLRGQSSDFLNAEMLTEFLAADEVELADTAIWIAGRHPEWADTLTDYFRQRLEADDIEGVQFVALQRQLAAFADARTIQDLLAERLGDVTGSDMMRRLVLRTMTASRLKAAPESWIVPLRRALASHSDAVVTDAVHTVSALALPPDTAGGIAAQLIRIAHADTREPELRLDALAAVPGELAEVDAEIFALLRAQLQPDGLAGRRAAAAAILAKAKLSSAQLVELSADLADAGPLEIEKLLTAFAQSQDAAVGAKLVEVLPQAHALAALHVETLKPVLEKFGPKLEKPAAAIYATLTAGSEQERAGLETLLAELKDGDVRRGQAVFNSAKAACASCHAIGYVGGNVGPDLTRVGQIRTERDLLESIVLPSASFVRSYEPVQVQTVDGKVYSGVVRGDSTRELTLATGAKEQVRIPREEIDQMQPGKVSIMPTGLDKQLSHQELADLVAFLKACR